MLLGDKIQCYALCTYTYNRLLDKGLKIKNKNKKKKRKKAYEKYISHICVDQISHTSEQPVSS